MTTTPRIRPRPTVDDLRSTMSAFLLDQAWTPDALEINSQFELVPVFIYGTEKVGYSEDLSTLGPCRVGIGYTENPHMLMYFHHKDKYPVVMHGLASSQGGKIQGHLFLVPNDVLFELDAKYQNQAYFKRARYWVKYKAPLDRSPVNGSPWLKTSAFMYMGMHTAWLDKIKKHELSLMPLIKAKSKELQNYYLFPRNEDITLTPGG